jgi:hypothetical protein
MAKRDKRLKASEIAISPRREQAMIAAIYARKERPRSEENP